MNSNQRIVLNTVASYSRTLVGVFLGLFSSRWVLQSLGQTDYGLYGVVGSVIVFITFLNGVTSGAVSRFFAFSIGRGDPGDTNRWFNTALLLHIVVPFVLLLVGWPMGEWLVIKWLNIPANREHVCVWVFRLSLVAAFVNMVATPFIGMHVAKQRIAELSAWGFLYSIGTFLLAYLLRSVNADKLLFYCSGVVLITTIFNVVQMVRACFLFPECKCRIRLGFDWQRIRQIYTFSGWILFGALGALFKGQSLAILLNKYFNPVAFPFINASYGIATQVSAQTQALSVSLMNALTPEITSNAGSGDHKRMLMLSLRASKLSTFLILLFAIPLLVEMDYVLKLWLKQPPELASCFSSLMIADFIVNNLTVGQMVAVRAMGVIAGYQMLVGGALILTLPLAWGLLAFGFSPPCVLWAGLFTMSLGSIARVIFARTLLDMPVRSWVNGVFFPCLFLAALSYTIGLFVVKFLQSPSLVRLLIVTGACTAVSTVVGITYFFDQDEKLFFLKVVRGLIGGKK